MKGWRETEPSVELTLELPTMDLRKILDECQPVASLALYRLVQEALTNVFRHADASHASVSIACDTSQKGPRSLRVKVRDDGAGLKPDARPGLGLTGMRERMRALGGTFACGPRRRGDAGRSHSFPCATEGAGQSPGKIFPKVRENLPGKL